MSNTKPQLFMVVLKGASGTGKGTRVSQLIEYLKTRETPKIWRNNTSSDFGLFFPVHGFMFIGSYVVSNKSQLTSWSSMDLVHASLKTAENGRGLIKDAINYLRDNSSSKNLTLVLEGEPMLLSDKYRPEFIESEYTPDHLVLSYYMYESREQYDERIKGRSGVEKGGDSGWSRAASYLSDFNKSKEESMKLDHTKCHISMRGFDEEVWRWGCDLLSLLGWDDPSVFAQWAKDNPMLRSVGGNNPLSKTKKFW